MSSQKLSLLSAGTAALTLIVSRPNGATWRVETMSAPASRLMVTVRFATAGVGFPMSTNVEYCCGPPTRASPVDQWRDGSTAPWLLWPSEGSAAARSQYIERSAAIGWSDVTDIQKSCPSSRGPFFSLSAARRPRPVPPCAVLTDMPVAVWALVGAV